MTSFPDVQFEKESGLIGDMELVTKETSSPKILTIEHKQKSNNSLRQMRSPSSNRFKSFQKIKLAMASGTSLHAENQQTQLFISPSQFKQPKQEDLKLVGRQANIRSPKGQSSYKIEERTSTVETGKKDMENFGENKVKKKWTVTRKTNFPKVSLPKIIHFLVTVSLF